MFKSKKEILLFGLVLTASGAAAEAAQVMTYNPVNSSNNNFTFILSGPPESCPASGCMVDGANDVAFSWDGTVFTTSSDYNGPGGVGNATLASTRPIMGVNWTMHDIQIFGPGSYLFDPSVGGGVPETGMIGMTVGAGQLGVHMLMDWNYNLNMDIVVVWNKHTTFGPEMFTGNPNPDGNSLNTVWMLASTDADGNGISGVQMAANGPFTSGSYSAEMNFNLKGSLAPVPVPAAGWLLGAGLISLMGAIKRRKEASTIAP